ncbi:hypothetical protein ACFSCX_19400 [Bacillus salitolerans]|uniref:Lipoprotein n=1 Tax=Bacillus salitolerans TaxID=1437434 RepID=A0ABW4LU60_9BACI
MNIKKKIISFFWLMLFMLVVSCFFWSEYKESKLHKALEIEDVRRINWTLSNKLSMYGAEQSGIEKIVSWFNQANNIEKSEVLFDLPPVEAELTIYLKNNKTIHIMNHNGELLKVKRDDLGHV